MGRILVSRVCALGDLVLTLPFLQALRSAHLGASLHFLGHGEHGDLLVEAGIVHRAWSVESCGWHVLYGEAESVPFDALHPDPRDYQEIYLFAADPERSSLFKTLRNLRGERVHWVPARPRPEEAIHASQHMLHHLPSSTAPMEGPLLSLQGCGSRDPVESIRSCWERGLVPLILHPGSGSVRKNWPAERYSLLLATARDRCPQLSPLILEGPSDKKPVRALMGENRDAGGWPVLRPSNLLELACILQECALFVGNDSGVTHLAGALGVPTVAIFGPSDPTQWAPLGPCVRLVERQEDCSPCHLHESASCDRSPCQRFPSVEEVWEAVAQLLVRECETGFKGTPSRPGPRQSGTQRCDIARNDPAATLTEPCRAGPRY